MPSLLRRTFRRHPYALTLGLVLFPSLALGFWLTFSGTSTWDSPWQAHLGRYVLGRVLPWWSTPIPLNRGFFPNADAYGPLWEFVAQACADIVFAGLRDPEWVRHAVTFALFPITLALSAVMLLRAGVSRPSTAVAVVGLLAIVRLGGSALLNTKDVPFACGFLLASLAMWLQARALASEATDLSERARVRAALLAAAMGTTAAAVYLLRPVLPLHLAAGLVFVVAVSVGRGHWTEQASPPLAYMGAWLVACYAVWPPFRGHGLATCIAAFSTMSRYPWYGPVTLLGQTFDSTEVPRWYAPAWFVVGTPPALLAAIAVGLVRLVVVRRRLPRFELALGRRAIEVPLASWLGAFAATAWAGAVVVHPILYDEDRHLLFLYPPLVVLAAMGFVGAVRTCAAVAAALLLTATQAYAHWGLYSYVYKSPLVDARPGRFEGDYWGVCMQEGVRALAGRVPAGAVVVTPDAPDGAARMQLERLRSGRFARVPGMGNYEIVADVPDEARQGASYYVLTYNRRGNAARVFDDIARGKARLLWKTDMPPGEPACVLAQYGPRESQSAAEGTDGR